MAAFADNCDAGAMRQETLHHFKTQGLQAFAVLPITSDHAFITHDNFLSAELALPRAAHVGLEGRTACATSLEQRYPDFFAPLPATEEDCDPARRVPCGARTSQPS